MAKKATVFDVRRRNRALLFRKLLLSGETSRRELEAATGLSPATVANVVAKLIEEGVVFETGFRDSDGGRPRALLQVNPDAGYVVGVDVSESSVATGLFDLCLNQRAQRTHSFVGRHIEPDEVGDIVVDHVSSVLEETGVPKAKVFGVGMGVPGVVERPSTPTAVVHTEVIGWEGVSFDWLERRLGIPLLVDNGAKTTTQAESWYGAARGAEHAVVVIIGDGVGAGIITNGRLYRGASSGAGEWGHTKISLGGPPCRCGSVGCVEAIVGASGVLRSWLGDDRYNGREAEGIEDLLSAMRGGDPGATAAFTAAIDHLGLALSNLINLYNPEKIVIGGWFGDVLMRTCPEELRAAARRFSLSQPGLQAVLDRSTPGVGAVALGAATLPVDRFIETGLDPSLLEQLKHFQERSGEAAVAVRS